MYSNGARLTVYSTAISNSKPAIILNIRTYARADIVWKFARGTFSLCAACAAVIRCALVLAVCLVRICVLCELRWHTSLQLY